MAEWRLDQGSGDTWSLTLYDENGNAEVYTGTETLAGQVWAGGSQPALATFTPAWVTPGAGLLSATILGTATAALAPGRYKVRITLTPTGSGANTNTVYRGELRIDPAPTAASTATATATVSSGTVSALTAVTLGTGYSRTPLVTFSGGGGSGAQAVASLSAGRITGYTVIAGGAGYTSAPTVTVAAPDTAVYCSYQDMLTIVGWIGTLQGESDLAGFLAERGRARQWFDDICQRHYRGGGGLSRDNYFLPWPQYIPGNPNRLASIFRSGSFFPSLQSWLDADGLRQTPQIAEACACYAVGRVLERQIGQDAKNAYAELARKYLARAEDAIKCIEAEVDTSGSAYVSTTQTIKLGMADTLEG